jgi:hypothetical protein
MPGSLARSKEGRHPWENFSEPLLVYKFMENFIGNISVVGGKAYDPSSKIITLVDLQTHIAGRSMLVRRWKKILNYGSFGSRCQGATDLVTLEAHGLRRSNCVSQRYGTLASHDQLQP